MIGRYKLLEKLGEGGFGSIWAAEQRDPVRRRVAVKIITMVWNPSTGQECARLMGHDAEITAVAFSPDGKSILTGSVDQTARVWGAADGKELLSLNSTQRAIRSVAVSLDGMTIAAASEDHAVYIWKAATPTQVSHWLEERNQAEERLLASGRSGPKSQRMNAPFETKTRDASGNGSSWRPYPTRDNAVSRPKSGLT